MLSVLVAGAGLFVVGLIGQLTPVGRVDHNSADTPDMLRHETQRANFWLNKVGLQLSWYWTSECRWLFLKRRSDHQKTWLVLTFAPRPAIYIVDKWFCGKCGNHRVDKVNAVCYGCRASASQRSRPTYGPPNEAKAKTRSSSATSK